MWCAATELGQGVRLMRGESSRLPGKCGCRWSGVALMGSRPRSVNTKRLGIRLMKCILKRWMRLSVFLELENLLSNYSIFCIFKILHRGRWLNAKVLK